MNINFNNNLNSELNYSEDSYWVILNGYEILLDSSYDFPKLNQIRDLNVDISSIYSIGIFGGKEYYCASLSDRNNIPGKFNFTNFRALLPYLSREKFNIAGKGFQTLYWDYTHQYCGICGSKLLLKNDERAKYCEKCDQIFYTRISPAIIVAVVKDDKLLMAQSVRFKNKMYSVLAGFLEIGETLEECVQREVMEETGIAVQDIQYLGSQPWPFPDSFMIAFTAKYKSGEIKVDKSELLDAKWFTAEDIKQTSNLPTKLSIASKLIDWFINQYNQNK